MTTPLVDETPDADPLAVAAGNASLLGIGYLLLRRRGLALGTGVVTVLLVGLVVATASVLAEVAVVLWWLAMIGHGWRLAGGGRSTVRDQRARWIGIAPAAVVLLVFGLLRTDADRTTAAVDDARLRGDCSALMSTQDVVRFGPRLANAPAAARADDTAEVCTQLAAAQGELDQVFGGSAAGVPAAYDRLAGVMARYPGHERMVEIVVDRFVTRLPAPSACTTAAVTDEFAAQPPAAPSIDRLRTTAVRLRPAALVGCGDLLRTQRQWGTAETRYRALLTEFPRDALVTRARAGADTAAAERRLPEYCTTPFGYPGAPVPGPGLNRALFPDASPDVGPVPGKSPDADRLPAPWRARGVTEAALVICAGDRERGAVLRTCPYTIEAGSPLDVTYHRIALPVRVFEFRTGRVVLDTRVEIGGDSCPPTLPVTFSEEMEGLQQDLLSRPDILYDTGLRDRQGNPVGGRTAPEPRRATTTRDVYATDADVDGALRGALTPLVQR